MLHWLYDPKRKIRRFAEENIKAKPVPVKDPKVLHIMEMAANNGMRPSDVDSLASELDPLKLFTPKTNDERFDQIFYLMVILLDDLNFDAAERDLVKEFALEIGYPVEKSPFIIREVYNGLKTELTFNEIKKNVNQILS